MADRLIHSVGVTETGASPSAWKPPTLKPKPMPERLALTLSVEAEKSDGEPTPRPEEPGMVFIEAGRFVIGDDEGGRDAQPQHRVMLDGYWIDRLPVTNADYMTFVEATDYRRPAHWVTGTFPAENGKPSGDERESHRCDGFRSLGRKKTADGSGMGEGIPGNDRADLSLGERLPKGQLQ